MSGTDTISITPDPEHTKEENVTYRSALRVSSDPGPSPCIPNGPTEETIECRRHERVESTRGVSFHPIVRAPSAPPPRPLEILF